MYDVAIVGGGIAGMATAGRLQSRGYSTLVLESHVLPGGCAGFYRRKGFSFDVGATTLVDFAPGGIGAQFLQEIGIDGFDGEHLPGYVAWLPDRKLTLSRDPNAWSDERLRALGDSAKHRRFWKTIDKLAAVYWRAARRGARLPIRSVRDAMAASLSVGLAGLCLSRYLGWTMGDLLRDCDLQNQRPLVALLAMLIEDTVHSTVDAAPLINAALGVTIRGAGLSRARGGMRGFWSRVVSRYRDCGGELRTRTAVQAIERRPNCFVLSTDSGTFRSRQVVSTVPATVTARLAPRAVADWLTSYIQRDARSFGGAVLVCLGVPDSQVANQPFTHHQLLHDYLGPLGEGNNMFISVSAPNDVESAPVGFRSVMLSTHCELACWENLSDEEYIGRKNEIGQLLVNLARRVYPQLAEPALVMEVATPRTYQHFTGRPRGAVGGVRQNLLNSNQNAIPHRSPVPGFWLAGDTTWPGLGTVACLLSSRIVAEGVGRHARRQRRPWYIKKPDDLVGPGWEAANAH